MSQGQGIALPEGVANAVQVDAKQEAFFAQTQFQLATNVAMRLVQDKDFRKDGKLHAKKIAGASVEVANALMKAVGMPVVTPKKPVATPEPGEG